MNSLSTLASVSLIAVLCGIVPAQSFVVPSANATQPGDSSSGFPFSYTGYVRYQQVIATSEITPGPIAGMSFRGRTTIASLPGLQLQGIEVRLSDSVNPVGALSGNYPSNVGANVLTVFNGTVGLVKDNPLDPLEFNVTIAFDAPYVHTNQQPLLVDLIPTGFQGQPCGFGGNGTSLDYQRTTAVMSSVLGKNPAGCGIPTTGGTPGLGGFVIKFFQANVVMPYGPGCLGTTGTVPVVGSASAATVGNASFVVTMTGASAASASAGLILGGRQDLVDLGVIGMPNCFLNTSFLDGTTATVVGGNAAVPLPIPALPVLSGLDVRCQWVVLDPGANPLGLVTSQGGLIPIR